MLSGKHWEKHRKAEDAIKDVVRTALEGLAGPDKETNAFRVLQFIRDESHSEMTLIGTRLTWLLAAQAFLVTGSVIATSNALNKGVQGPGWLAVLVGLVSLVGGIISWRSIQAIEAAEWTIKLWHERLRLLIEETRKTGGREYHAMILGRWCQAEDPVHAESLKLSKLIPITFILFWAILFLFAIGLATRLSFSL